MRSFSLGISVLLTSTVSGLVNLAAASLILRLVNMMPLFHVGGIIRNLFAPVMSGGSAIICPGFDPIAFWNLAAELHATWFVLNFQFFTENKLIIL